jgi:hypothetical protein
MKLVLEEVFDNYGLTCADYLLLYSWDGERLPS